jgi:hypothetical protein
MPHAHSESHHTKRNFFTDVRFEVLRLLRTMRFFQVVTPCRQVGRYHHLGETYCFHIQGSSHGLYLRVYTASQPRTTSSSLIYLSLFVAVNKRLRLYKAYTTVCYNIHCNNIICQNSKIRNQAKSAIPMNLNFSITLILTCKDISQLVSSNLLPASSFA